MKRSLILIPLLLLSLLCITDAINTVDTPLYKGKGLTIGVIGNIPTVREENIQFKTIDFNDLIPMEDLSSEFDAIFIMKENLSEASDAKNEAIYKNANIPFFFIQSKKSNIPFVVGDLSYEGVPDFNDQSYATGYYQAGEKSDIGAMAYLTIN